MMLTLPVQAYLSINKHATYAHHHPCTPTFFFFFWLLLFLHKHICVGCIPKILHTAFPTVQKLCIMNQD